MVIEPSIDFGGLWFFLSGFLVGILLLPPALWILFRRARGKLAGRAIEPSLSKAEEDAAFTGKNSHAGIKKKRTMWD